MLRRRGGASATGDRPLKGQLGSRLVDPTALHSRDGGEPPHRPPREGGIHPGGTLLLAPAARRAVGALRMRRL